MKVEKLYLNNSSQYMLYLNSNRDNRNIIIIYNGVNTRSIGIGGATFPRPHRVVVRAQQPQGHPRVPEADTIEVVEKELTIEGHIQHQVPGVVGLLQIGQRHHSIHQSYRVP